MRVKIQLLTGALAAGGVLTPALSQGPGGTGGAAVAGGPGGPGGGGGGARGGGGGGKKGFNFAAMKNFNPLSTKVDPANPMSSRRADRNKDLFAMLTAVASNKSVPQTASNKKGR